METAAAADKDLEWEQYEELLANLLSFDEVRGKSKLPLNKIAIRVFRAAHELSLHTVAIYSHEDRLMQHRSMADEGYEISGPGVTPVGAYLDIKRIVSVAKRVGVSAIHPGYGFLSENPEFVRAVEAAGIIFVGPTADVMEMMGDKTLARKAAIAAGLPVVPGTPDPVHSIAELQAFTREHGFPIILKAAFGGGGRGMRVVRTDGELEEALARASSEAKAAFGNGAMFAERFIERPRHIEVQILADNVGNTIHLFERDCSVQRRHQKVVEVAPATHLDPEVRDAILKDAVKLCASVKYRNAGTVEFLVDPNNRYYFIEVNPRIQVEHTVTEEITGVDLVAAQIQIAAGRTLADLRLLQENISMRGCAIQCRITTEDAAHNFTPDTGTLHVYRASAGPGIRLDGSHTQGGYISPHYDSLLVKVTARAHTRAAAIRRMLRALTEFRVRGVKTNIPFLQKLLLHPLFLAGEVHTCLLDEDKSLFKLPVGRNRAQKALVYFADVLVNGASIEGMIGHPGDVVPVPPALAGIDVLAPPPRGWKQVLDELGPEGFAKAIRAHKGLLLTDTTWRDAHQSLLMTRMRTKDLENVAPHTAHAFASCLSFECWGGATFDVALRFLHECPWERLEVLRKLVPNVPFQMLLRGANAVGYTSYPDNVVYAFVQKAREKGVDIFRVFDSLNYVENLELGIDAVRKAGGVVEAAICYTGDVSDPHKTKYNLQYYLDLARKLVDYGIHILAIKDMAGLLKPRAARMLIGALRAAFPDLPIHVHTHDTAGTGVASMLAAAEAGADAVDVAVDSMSGMTSQPSMGAVVAALEGTDLDTNITFGHMQAINHYWEQVRELYRCFDSGLTAGCSDVYIHEMPGGQYTNLQFQARSLGLGEQWTAIKKAYAEANQLLGDIVKVTPSSKVCGDLAQFMVQNSLDAKQVLANAERLNFPQSVVQYFQGFLGEPPGGFPEPLRTLVVGSKPVVTGRPGASLPSLDLKQLRRDLVAKHGPWVSECDVLSAAMYPAVFEEYAQFQNRYGDVSVIDTPMLLQPLKMDVEYSMTIEPGKTLYVKLMAVSTQISKEGTRDVFFDLNGSPRRIVIRDKTSKAEAVQRRRADPSKHTELGAPMAGAVVEIRVKPNSVVKVGDPVCVLNAMKMETVVTAPVAGIVEELFVRTADSISAGDLVAVFRPQ